jgi:hypothetical protein
MTTTSVFAEIIKTAPQADGSLLVHGKATGSDLDLDQQQCDPKWLKKAMPEWFKIGNIRESHDAKRAVGKATDYESVDGDHMITAKVVDPLSKAKIEAGILTGFSIGIKSPRIMKSETVKNGIICDGQIIEVSLVDRPALPTATLTICKAATEGWEGKAEDYDAERNLVHVEELTIQNEDAAKAAAGESDETKKPTDPKKPVEGDDDNAEGEKKDDDKKGSKKSAVPSPLNMPGAKITNEIKIDGQTVKQVAQDEINKAIEALTKAIGTARESGTKTPNEAREEQGLEPIEKATDTDKLHEPAPGQKCGDCGEDGHLACKSADAEEFDVESTKALVESILKGDGLGQNESGDISGAEQAIQQIAQLISSEAKALAKMPAQDCDIHLLMSAVDALRRFSVREKLEGMSLDPSSIYMSADADKTKGSKYDTNQMAAMLKSGEAIANPKGDPSYPIADEEDLGNAIKAVGRGSGDHTAIRTHITKRANALGKADMLPGDWAEKVVEVEPQEVPDLSKALTGALEDEESDLRKTLSAIHEESIEKALGDFTAKAQELVTKSFEEISARLALVEKMATPGGPALRRTEQEVKTSRRQDLLGLAEIEERKANTPGLDTTLRLGYQEKAARLRADANSL